ncbi:PREDICTED: RNA polymerase II C-terminal domain phosphatase-like 3 [Nelumbo nucifera]|uniref:protein-serine/threonine phosphatase n=2 Tax=Nelumbo nucifera TaxID=4432 RepID=A0A1U7ZMI4_NELNU|nr:PREDICTED: RNA polymerase II C-terminal domain phosphatase-like 3 [Nelumbo nucifera]DAD30439.1 TPA_asm: hypothetical protein HUJ06_009290 [Nelumbo nucifera]
MRIAGSNRYYFLNPNEKEILAKMKKEGSPVEDIEEGEISGGEVSDSESVEEITEQDFKNDAKGGSKETTGEPKQSPKGGESRAWYQYPVTSGYGSGFHNLAWAQAVQNRPLDEVFVRDFGSDEKLVRSVSKPMINSREDNNNNNRSLNSSSKEVCNLISDDSSEEIDSKMAVVGEDEKEEGELEEGEIDLDSEMVESGHSIEISSDGQSNAEKDLKEKEFEKRLNSIRECLETVTVKEADKSFDAICFRMRTSLESLQAMISENRVPAMDDLIEQSFTGIQTINSVYCSMTPQQQEQNKDIFSRLIVHLKIQEPVLFSPDRMKEIESMVRSLDCPSALSNIKVLNQEKEALVGVRENIKNSSILSEKAGNGVDFSKKFQLEPMPVKYGDWDNLNTRSETSKAGLSFGSRSRIGFGPLLDLHRDHDADSLPSPTRKAPPPLPMQKPLSISDGTPRSDLVTNIVEDKMDDTALHPYETDALKAVSTYQQKFGRTSLLLSDRLPSPTPSEECDDGDGDINGEVSSSTTVGGVATINSSTSLKTVSSATSYADNLSGQGLVPAVSVGQLGSMSSHVIRTAKNRDPRLRYANSEVGPLDLNQRPPSGDHDIRKSEPLGGIMGSRKHKIVEESLLDDHTFKRQRNGLINSGASGDVQVVSGSGGWLEESSSMGLQPTDRSRLIEKRESDPRKLGSGEASFGNKQDTGCSTYNVTTGGNEQLTASGIGSTVSLPSLLKDIAVNPTMLMHLIKMEHQRLAVEALQKCGNPAQSTMQSSSSSVMPGKIASVNIASKTLSEPEKKSAGNSQISVQTASMIPHGDLGKIRMKPRDPRRILHSNTFQKSDSSGPERFKANGTPSPNTPTCRDNLIVRQQGEQAQTNSLLSQSTAPPDIAQQFTKKLKNIANILSASQAINTPSVVPQTISSQPVPAKMDKVDMKVVATDSNDQRSWSALTPEERAAGPSSQNAWGDVEHLFEGYDDQQKAAIQRERARRIEEQNQMFAARKLCLVLDLDHTLLNSAKFVEVDPVHEEMLRKKEEQDREKPQRHLFRFTHMGMWTKLRPGIWNFLEKASKLYELHLYTMGNKLYATEMAKVLDPTGVLFAGRVISRGDDGDPFDGDERQPKSKDLDGVLGMESAVVIIDDSVRVWPHNKLNLIVVERYTYFPCSRRQLGLHGPSLLEIDHDERPEDGTLASSLAVIERIHQNFFSHQNLNDVDVRNILAAEQQKILAGCRIVFSRVFPVGEANPHLHPLWQTAEQFGAVCTNQIDEQVTHVVAISLGTDKVNWALSTGRFVVHPGWVEASALLYRRANEHDFAIKL